jgi:hypothetical protein
MSSAASALLVAAANERGGPDNTSTVMAEISKQEALSRPTSLRRELSLHDAADRGLAVNFGHGTNPRLSRDQVVECSYERCLGGTGV